MKKIPMIHPLVGNVFWVYEDEYQKFLDEGCENARLFFMGLESFYATKRREIEKQLAKNNIAGL